ncbi:TonB-dependent receptor [Desulfarculus baarsii DSM 2075]|uniref:TonB-dependent receptor n=1 Tax=Desulfarculus baarsii (strain ATCC 33931 / DSM 2075 / LMG 7858 / VKM B-1802 / 2st14) TaxID=644282 RepID=E1QIS2_DESB2|nr:TonB-dependent receptor [Desulfarculus baarsii]ADK84495.1 TonB-dependent receptor [Desulfarculus baarsii DSM 2075]
MSISSVLGSAFGLLAIMASAIAWAGPAMAQEAAMDLEPVVVTAEKRQTTLQDVPASISVFSEADIKDARIQTIQDLSRLTPNMYIANWGIRGTSYVFVRGVGSINNEPAIGYYVDDVGYMDARAFDANLFDIERIEVLRGPQGALYGRNSLAGVINIITKKPDNQTRAGAELTAGNYNNYQAGAHVAAPLVEDKLFLRMAGYFETRDGYTENDFLDQDVDHHQSFNGRAQMRWTPSDKLDISANIEGESVDDGAFPLGRLADLQRNPHHVAYDHEGKYKRDAFGPSLRVVYDAPWFQLTSITAYRDFDDSAANDQDFTIYPLITAYEDIADRQFTQELRFASPESDSALKWLVGLYGFNKDKTHHLNLNFAPDLLLPGMSVDRDTDSDLTTNGMAVFGQTTYTLFKKLDLTVGLRYDYENNDIHHVLSMSSGEMNLGSNKVDASENNGAWLPKFQVAYHWTPRLMTYAGVARGYRSGGFNTAYADESDIRFDPEYSWNYEVGLKTAWFENRLIVNAALFYIDLQDQQVVQLLPSADTAIRNAGQSRSMGMELELRALLCQGLTLDAGFGYTDAEYTDYRDPLAGADYSGNKAVLAPEYTYNLALEYRRGISAAWDAFLRAELNGVGPFYWNDANTLKQDPYQLVNLSLGFEREAFDLVLWARNLFDENYEAVAFEFPGSDPVGQSGDPLTFGATVRVRF